MTTKKSKSKKEKSSDDYKQTSFLDSSDESLRSESSCGISGGHHSNKRDKDTTYEKNNFQEESNKGFVVAFARQVSLSGVEHFYSILVASNFDLWPKLAQQWQRGKEAHKANVSVVGKARNG